MNQYQKQQSDKIRACYLQDLEKSQKKGPGSRGGKFYYDKNGLPIYGEKKGRNPYNELFSKISENNLEKKDFKRKKDELFLQYKEVRENEDKRLKTLLSSSPSLLSNPIQDLEEDNFSLEEDIKQKKQADNILLDRGSKFLKIKEEYREIKENILNTLDTLVNRRLRRVKEIEGIISSHLKGGVEHLGQYNLLKRFSTLQENYSKEKVELIVLSQQIQEEKLRWQKI